jgi:hypothetical protein
MRKSGACIVSMLLFVPSAFGHSGSTSSGSIRTDVFTKGPDGEPAVLPGVLIVLHGPKTNETESDAKGAFAVDGLPAGANSFEDAPQSSLTDDDRKWLKAMDCAFSRKVHHA